MPCRSDYDPPSGKQLESIRVCELIIYLWGRIGRDVPDWIVETTKEYYGNVARLDEATKILCETCRSLTEEETEQLIYDGHDAGARRLAGWWDRHQEWDKRRIAEEKKER